MKKELIYRKVIFYTMEDITEAKWDGLVGDNVLFSHGWLKTIEQTLIQKVNRHYFLIYDAEGPAGAAVCYLQERGAEFVGNLDHVVFGRLRKYATKVDISCLPALVCCPLYRYGNPLITHKGLASERQDSIIKELLNTIEEKAASKGIPVAFINITEDESELVSILKKRGYESALDVPLAYLDIQWPSFREYIFSLKNISRNVGKNISYQINKSKKEGVIIKNLEYIEGYEKRIYELLNNNSYKYNRMPFTFKEIFLKVLKENLGQNIVCYAAFKGGVLIGVSLVLKRNGAGSVIFVGVDHEASGNDFTYFNIAYYRPIEDAILAGMKRLYYGRGMYVLKIRRGCRIKRIYTYYRPVNFTQELAIKAWFMVLSLWIKILLHKIFKNPFSNQKKPIIL